MSPLRLDQQLIAEDGTRIAYGTMGCGPALMLTNGLTTDTTFWKYVSELWSQQYTVIAWDLPGHGRSGPAQSPLTAAVDTLPRWMCGILDQLNIDRALHVGWSTGCQVVLEMYRQYPERCAALGLLFGPAGRVLETTQLPLPGAWFAPVVRALPPRAFELMCRGVSRALEVPGIIPLGRKLKLVGAHTHDRDVRDVFTHIGTVDPNTLREMLLSLQAHSAHAVLPNIRVPVLIFAGDRDPFAPSAQVGMLMHAAAPDSQLVRLPEGTHTAMLDEPDVISRAVQALARRVFQ
jgi:pimeloyl-ACP methyl ester carboxylesterase